MSYSVERLQLHTPSLEEVSAVLKKGFDQHFDEVQVSVVDCPDLTASPYHLANKGLCGSPRLVDIGGVPYLHPLPQMNKCYDLRNVPQWTGMTSETFMIGAGAAPMHVVGVLAEMLTNINIDTRGDVKNESWVVRVVPETGAYSMERFHSSTDSMHLINLFVSEGKPGKVLEVRAAKRKGIDFIACLLETLKQQYGTQPVGLGGVFVMTQGKARVHVMPKYCVDPLTSKDQVDKWLKFFDMSAPLVCCGYVVSHDPGMFLRPEHFHCHSAHGDGGHFHEDSTPETVEYVAYFTVPEYLYRVDNTRTVWPSGLVDSRA